MDSDNRRTFFVTLIYGLWGVISAALALPAAAYLLLPPRAKKTGEWVPAGDAGQLQPDVPEEMVFRRNRVDGWKITSEKTSAWVVKTAANQVVAYAPQCTHLGCAYRWDEKGHYFLCPCHTSTFGLDGKVLSGPAPRPLDRYEVKVESGKILIGPVEKGTTA
jgi:menaquinol-cytochrome c reductase iron-sulfur subunit